MLQGFPQTYSFLPDDEPVSFATLGRLIGNAVPVTLGKAIGEVLVQHVERSQDDNGIGSIQFSFV
jgi:DNA (cytosine-5)-methyltransferase 1